MDSDSDIEVVSSIKPLRASSKPQKPFTIDLSPGRFPSLSPISIPSSYQRPTLIPSNLERPAENKLKSPCLSPLVEQKTRNNIKPRAESKPKSPSGSPTPVTRNLKRSAEPSRNPNKKRSDDSTDLDSEGHSSSRDWLLSPPPSRSLSLKQMKSSNSHRNSPSNPDFALEIDSDDQTSQSLSSLSGFAAQNQHASQARAVRRDVSSTSESHSQPHCSTSTLRHVENVSKLLRKTRSAPQKPNEPLDTQPSKKGKENQADKTPENLVNAENDCNNFTNIEHDDDNLSLFDMPDNAPSVIPLPSNNAATNNIASSSRLEKQAKTAEARLAREAKKAAKEQEKLQARLDREANKLTLNRKETVAEVRMWVPKSLKQSKSHPLTKACEVLVERITSTEGCQMNQPGEVDDESSNEPKGVVRWIRTSNKEWDEGEGVFIRLDAGQTKETCEPTFLIVWTGKEVDETIAAGPGQLLKKAQAIKSHFPEDQLFIVISGLETILKAEKRRENAMITKEARARLENLRNNHTGESNFQMSHNSKKKNGLPQNSPNKILKELEILKIITKAFIIRVEDKTEFANWLWEMTLEIGVRPYKQVDNMISLGFSISPSSPGNLTFVLL